ncbi:MAG: HAMP domain-containing sensor histidine kinase [Myxococcota bacterium]
MRPLAYALILAATQLVAGVAYLVLCVHLGSGAQSVEELLWAEKLRWTAYVWVSALAVLGFSFYLLQRAERETLQCERGREALLKGERRALPGLLAASITQDGNTMLTSVLGDLYDLVGPAGPRGELQRASLARLERTLEALMAFNERMAEAGRHNAAGEEREVDVVALTRECLEQVQHHHQLQSCVLRWCAQGPLVMRGYPRLLQQMVVDLVLNAADATAGRGMVEVRVGGDQDGVILEVHDNGTGVPLDKREAIFQPFYTTKADASGLGLLTVKACAESHGGRVEVLDSASLGGACLRVLLPRAPKPPFTLRGGNVLPADVA